MARAYGNCMLIALGILVPVAAACGQSPVGEDPEAEIARQCAPRPPHYRISDACGPSRLGVHEPIYAVHQWTEGDENSLRLHYSFRYTLFVPDCLAAYGAATLNEQRLAAPASTASKEDREYARAERRSAAEAALACLRRFDERDEWYVMYTGEFDFYMGTRPSGPVVNRISNPGMHYRRYYKRPDDASWGLAWWDLGIEHRSDGQTTNPHALTHENQFRTQVAFENNDHAYLDSVSQDTNFVAIEAEHYIGKHLDLRTRLKAFYFDNDTAITWGPLANEDIEMADYDRLRLLASVRIGPERPSPADEMRLLLEWTVGDKGLKTDSFNLGFYLPLRPGNFRIPLFFRAHYGPLHTLSDFAREQNSVGIGLLLQ